MAEDALSPSERARRESAVRLAAIAAGERAGWPVPRALLDRITAATITLQRSQADLERVAVGMVEQARNDPNAPDVRQPSEELNRYTRIIFGQVVHGFGWLVPSQARASSEAEAGDGETGARFDAMYTGSDWNSEAGQRYMRNYARQCGMGWAADHPDLMRLGPAGIHALRAANFTRESFGRLREAGFEGREAARVAVGISRYATRHGLDANRIAEETARGVEVFGGDSPEARRRWIERFNRFYANPDDAQAREEMNSALTAIETSPSSSPQQREHVRRLCPLLRLEQQERATQLTMEAQAEVVTAHVEGRQLVEGGNNAELAGLLDEPTPTPGASAQEPAPKAAPRLQPTQHVAGPR